MSVRDPNQLKYNRKYETLLNSFNTLKQIINPNINDIKKKFFNKLLDIITSQIKVYINLLLSNHSKNVYDILNINNQNLSKDITSFYDFFFKSSKEINNTIITSNNIIKQNKNYTIENELSINDNYEINEKKIREMELMEEPKPQVLSKFNVNFSSISSNKNEKKSNKNNIDEIKVKKSEHKKNMLRKRNNEKNFVLKDNTNDSFSNHSCARFNSDYSNVSSFKDEKLNLNLDNSLEIDTFSQNERKDNKNEVKKELEEIKQKNKKEILLKDNKKNHIYPFYKILNKNNKNINQKKLFIPIKKSNKIIKKITQNSKNEKDKNIHN
jgi:hypothetical protein